MCQTIADHEWRETLTGSGSHPTRGAYLAYRVRCESCGRTRWEQRFMRETPVIREAPAYQHRADADGEES